MFKKLKRLCAMAVDGDGGLAGWRGDRVRWRWRWRRRLAASEASHSSESAALIGCIGIRKLHSAFLLPPCSVTHRVNLKPIV